MLHHLVLGIYDRAGWEVIIGLACLNVGGLTLWAYGLRGDQVPQLLAQLPHGGPEADATRRFHLRLAQWFTGYAMLLMLAGFVLVLKAMVGLY